MAATARELLSQLRLQGIHYFADVGSLPGTRHRWARTRLLRELAETEDSRLHEALIPLLVFRPGFTRVAQELLLEVAPPLTGRIETSLLAALGLRYAYCVPLAVTLGHLPRHPTTRLSPLRQARHLPAPWVDYGEALLNGLEAQEQARVGMAMAFRSGWEDALRHGMQQEGPASIVKVGSLFPPHCAPRHVEADPASHAALHARAVIHKLACRVSEPTQLTLGSEATFTLAGLRAQVTPVDIALIDDNLPSSLQAALSAMRHDWIPDPLIPAALRAGPWCDHSHLILTDGLLEIYAFDWEVIALLKVAQGTTTHLADVELLARQRFLSAHQLETSFRELGSDGVLLGADNDISQATYEFVRESIFTTSRGQ